MQSSASSQTTASAQRARSIQGFVVGLMIIGAIDAALALTMDGSRWAFLILLIPYPLPTLVIGKPRGDTFMQPRSTWGRIGLMLTPAWFDRRLRGNFLGGIALGMQTFAIASWIALFFTAIIFG